jgi:hypothetical protein
MIKTSRNFIAFSMGRKTSLTTVEDIETIGKVVDGLTGIFGRGTRFGAQIENRVGSLLLSSHFLTSGKVVNVRDKVGKQSTFGIGFQNVVGQISFY